MIRSTLLLTAGTCLFGGLLHASPAPDSDLLRILAQKGYLTASEVEEIRTAQAAKDEAAANAVVATSASDYLVGLQLTGLLQFQYDGISASHYAGSSTSRVNFRRILVGVNAQLKNNWYATGAFDFANGANGGTGVLDHMFLGWKYSKELDAKVGYGKVPFGYETTFGPADIPTIETSIASNYFADVLKFNSFHAGAWASGEVLEGLVYEVAAANGGQGYRGNSGNGYSLWSRLQYTTEDVTSTIGDGKLMVGFDLGYQNSNPDGSLYLNSASIFGYTAYAQLSLGDLTLLAEATGATVQGVNGFDRSNPFGVTATASYMIDQFQPVFQYSFIDGSGVDFTPENVSYAALNASSVMRMHSVYLGTNYYIMGNDLRLSGGVIYLGAPAHSAGNSYDSVGVRAQLQVQF